MQARVETVAPRVAPRTPRRDIEPRPADASRAAALNAARPGGTTEGSASDAASSAGRTRGVAGGVQTSDTVPAASPGEALRGKDARLRLGGGDGGGDWSSSPRTARAWRSIAPSANVASAKGAGRRRVVMARARV